jgi:hypothetical protein
MAIPMACCKVCALTDLLVFGLGLVLHTVGLSRGRSPLFTSSEVVLFITFTFCVTGHHFVGCRVVVALFVVEILCTFTQFRVAVCAVTSLVDSRG